jgi:phytol kinase
MMSPWLGMALVLGTLGGLFAGLRLYQRRAAPHPELVRKLLHMGMGLVTLAFPWMFDEAWPVLVMAALSILGLVSLRLVQSLRVGLGDVVGAVKRTSLGEIYFPVAVTALFLLYLDEDPQPANRRVVLYCVPVLLLALADAAAALVGIGYGRWRYATADGEKSVEGSIAFFTLAFFCVHVPVLLFTSTDKAETLLIALLLAWLAMMFEAIAWRGLDNLVLPLVSFLLLKIYLDADVEDLRQRLGITAILTVFLVCFQHRSTLVGSAVLGAFLVGYISWALGGWQWLLAPLVLFVTYTLLSPRTEENSRRIHNIHAVVCVASAGMIWLFLAVIMERPEFLLPYTTAYAGHLAIIGIARLKFDKRNIPDSALVGLCVVKGWLLQFAPYFAAEAWTESLTDVKMEGAFVALAGAALAACVFYFTQPGLDDCPLDTPRWLRQGCAAGLGSAVGVVPLCVL